MLSLELFWLGFFGAAVLKVCKVVMRALRRWM